MYWCYRCCRKRREAKNHGLCRECHRQVLADLAQRQKLPVGGLSCPSTEDRGLRTISLSGECVAIFFRTRVLRKQNGEDDDARSNTAKLLEDALEPLNQ